MNDIERRKTIWLVVIFSILVNGIAWGAPLLGGSPASPGPGFILWGTAPVLVCLLLRVATRDWSDLGIKPGIRRNLPWYVISLVALPLVMLLVVWVNVLFSVASVNELSVGRFLQTVLTALPVFFVFALLEEVGWRGYLAPKLASLRINTYVASVLVGIVWASWHLPYIRELTWVYSSEDLLSFIPRYYLVCFALSIVLGSIRDITASFWPAVLMHAVVNSFGHPLSAEYVKIVAGKEYLGSISTGLFFITFVMLLGVILNHWQAEKSVQY